MIVRLPDQSRIPDNSSYGRSDGTSDQRWLVSPTGDLSAVAQAGREVGDTYRMLAESPDGSIGATSYLMGALGTYLGHGGVFDYQRRGNMITGYTQLPQFRHVSNFNIGLFAQQAGLPLEDTLRIAGTFAKWFSSNYKPHQPYGLDPENVEFIRKGFDAGTSGTFDR